MSDRSQRQIEGFSRRRALQGLSALSLTTIMAGCGSGGEDGAAGDGGGGDGAGDGGGDGGGEELGERVPTIRMVYAGGLGGQTTIMEAMSPMIAEDLAELGIQAEVLSMPIGDLAVNMQEDTRQFELIVLPSSSTPDRLDPHEFLTDYTIDTAGAGDISASNFAHCEYTRLAYHQAEVGPDERREVVTEAFNIAAAEYAFLPIIGDLRFQVANPDTVETGGTGQAGLSELNPISLIDSRPIGRNQIRISIDSANLTRNNWTALGSSSGFYLWNQLVYSPLLSYDETYTLSNSLASGWEANDDGTQITVELADATFHNGEPITAEDVQFTFQFISDNFESIYRANQIPLESINVVDDSTVEFNWSRPYPIFVTREMPGFGILNKAQWEPADGAPGDFQLPADIVGSGPFSVETFSADQSLSLRPHDGHPTFSPDHGLLFVGFADGQSATQAFEAGEIDVLTVLAPAGFERLTRGGDYEGFTTNGFVPGPGIWPQFPMAPIKFRPFRQAMGTAINRQRLNDVVTLGEGIPQTHPIQVTTEHPWHPDNIEGSGGLQTVYTDDPTGDVEAARQVLEDAGWGWDGEGRLHYPPGADTTPLWPAESNPGPDNFPCVDEDGNYAE